MPGLHLVPENTFGNEHMAQTIHATVTQFNSVAKCVITTCLGDLGMMAQERAWVVKHCMKVARVCHWRSSRVALQSPGTATSNVTDFRIEVCGLNTCSIPMRQGIDGSQGEQLEFLPCGQILQSIRSERGGWALPR